MTRRLRRFLAMDGQHRRLFVAAWLSLPVIDLLLRVIGLERTRRLLARASPVPPGDPREAAGRDGIELAEELAGLIALAGRHAVANGTCLRQALLLWWMLRRRGLASEIRIGVSKQDGFRAHAWVELAGREVGQSPRQQARLVRLEQLRLR